MRKAAVFLISVLMVFIFLGILLTNSLMIVQRIATASEVTQPAWIESRTAGELEPLRDGARVFAGAMVMTGEGGSATLNWVNGSRIRMDPDTTLKVQKCSLNKNNQASVSLFHLDVGRVWIRILETLGERSKFEIRTPTATAGVRGTVFSVAVSAQGDTRVSVYEGSVAVEGAGELVEAAAGESAALGGQTTPVKTAMTEAEAAAWVEQAGIIGPHLQLDTEPDAKVAADAESVTVAGAAERDTRVTVNGQPAQLGPENRCQVEVPFDSDQPQLTVAVVARDRRGAETLRELVFGRSE